MLCIANIGRINIYIYDQTILGISFAYLDQVNIPVATFAKRHEPQFFCCWFLSSADIFYIYENELSLIYFTSIDIHAGMQFLSGIYKMNIHQAPSLRQISVFSALI